MQLSPEVKAQLEEQKRQCIFCKIIKGEIPGKKVFEDDSCMATLDIYPALKGHTIFLPKEHYPLMPYMPAEEFRHFFGLLPAMAKAVKHGVVATGINMFIANGGAAGQQSAHFLMHLLPREESDSFFNFYFEKKGQKLEKEKAEAVRKILHSLMKQHFAEQPAVWHTGKGATPDFLPEFEAEDALYEDEKVICVMSSEIAPGHVTVYSKTEENAVEKLSAEDVVHLFYTASFAASAMFEGMKVHGTNIILKSGRTADNESGRLVVHVIPRMADDGLQKMLWAPKKPSYDLDKVAEKIKDKAWKIQEKNEENKKKEDKETVSVPIPRLVHNDKLAIPRSPLDEIREAIEKLKK